MPIGNLIFEIPKPIFLCALSFLFLYTKAVMASLKKKKKIKV